MAVLAGRQPRRVRLALVHIDVAVGSLEAGAAGAAVAVVVGPATSPIPAGLAGAVIPCPAVPTRPAQRTRAGVALQAGEVAGAAVGARRLVAHVGNRSLAQRVFKSERAVALELGRLVRPGLVTQYSRMQGGERSGVPAPPRSCPRSGRWSPPCCRGCGTGSPPPRTRPGT